MSTFLELCNKLHEKTGESGADLTTVTGQSGYYKRVVNLIKDAWVDIQSLHTTWRFLRQSSAVSLAASANSINANSLTYASLGVYIDEYHKNTFSIYETAVGITDESVLTYIPWEDWKNLFGITYADGEEGRPIHITIDPDTDQLIVGPTANAAYTVHFEFNQVPTEFSANSDTPNIVSSLHDIIFWKALETYGDIEESDKLSKTGRKNYRRLLARLRKRELPDVSLPDSLA